MAEWLALSFHFNRAHLAQSYYFPSWEVGLSRSSTPPHVERSLLSHKASISMLAFLPAVGDLAAVFLFKKDSTFFVFLLLATYWPTARGCSCCSLSVCMTGHFPLCHWYLGIRLYIIFVLLVNRFGSAHDLKKWCCKFSYNPSFR